MLGVLSTPKCTPGTCLLVHALAKEVWQRQGRPCGPAQRGHMPATGVWHNSRLCSHLHQALPRTEVAGTFLCRGLGVSGCLRGESLAEMTAGGKNGAGRANGTESDSQELRCTSGSGGKPSPVGCRLTSAPFAWHPASLCHVPAFAPSHTCWLAPAGSVDGAGRWPGSASICEQSACPSVLMLGSSLGQKQARGSTVGLAAERTQQPAQPPQLWGPSTRSPLTALARASSRFWEPKGPCAS